MTWFNTGVQAVEKEAKRNEEQRNNKAPRRIWLPANSEKKVIYLDDEGFSFYEHSYEQGGNSYNYHTCPGKASGCPHCASGKKPYLLTVYTVIDKSEYKDKTGAVHANEKRVHALKVDSALALARKSQRWGGLKGKEVVIARKGPKDAAAGSDFEANTNKDDKKIVYQLDPNNEKHRPFDYRAVYAPKSIEEIREDLGISAQDNAMSEGIPLDLAPSRPSYQSSSAAPSTDLGLSLVETPAEASTNANANPGADNDVPF